MTEIMTADDFDNDGAQDGGAHPPVPSTLSPQLEFKAVRDRLLQLEATKRAGGDISLKEVQDLTHKAAALLQQIQVSTAGPRKKAETVTGEAKTPKAKRLPKANIAIMPVEDF
jgi:hypothetical protein